VSRSRGRPRTQSVGERPRRQHGWIGDAAFRLLGEVGRPRLPPSGRPVGEPAHFDDRATATGLGRCCASLDPRRVRPHSRSSSRSSSARLRAVDLPAPCVCEIERAPDLAGAAMRHVPEPSWIAAMAAAAFGEVEHDAARGALDLVCGLGAEGPEPRDHRPQRSNQVQCHIVGDQHVRVLLGSHVGERNASCRRPPRLGSARRDRSRRTRDERPGRVAVFVRTSHFAATADATPAHRRSARGRAREGAGRPSRGGRRRLGGELRALCQPPIRGGSSAEAVRRRSPPTQSADAVRRRSPPTQSADAVRRRRGRTPGRRRGSLRCHRCKSTNDSIRSPARFRKAELLQLYAR